MSGRKKAKVEVWSTRRKLHPRGMRIRRVPLLAVTLPGYERFELLLFEERASFLGPQVSRETRIGELEDGWVFVGIRGPVGGVCQAFISHLPSRVSWSESMFCVIVTVGAPSRLFRRLSAS